MTENELTPAYNVIYADPPWQYRNVNTGGSMKSGSSAKYPTMPLEQIKALPVPAIARRDSVLYLWATTPLKFEAAEVMEAWGFTYKTTVYWHKVGRLGLGFWYRGEVEELYFGIRGHVPAFRMQEPNFIEHPTLKHSEKPHAFRELIERSTAQMPDVARLEMFARSRFPGWNAYGNQVDGSIRLHGPAIEFPRTEGAKP